MITDLDICRECGTVLIDCTDILCSVCSYEAAGGSEADSK